MFIRDGHLIVHMQMETVSAKFSQLLAEGDAVAAAMALNPIYSETRFGQTAMVFDGVDRAQLEPLGKVSTPSLSDLFVALMQRQTPATGAAK